MMAAEAAVYVGLLGLLMAVLGLGAIVIGRAYLVLDRELGGDVR